MTGLWGRDVDAPNTNWRAGSEDPLPYLFSRFPGAGFAYRFITGRPLDGHARTDATMWRAGTKAFTKTGKAMPYQFWPGWKRGLLITRLPAFGLLPYTAATLLADRATALPGSLLDTPWWLSWEAGAAAWLPHAAYASVQGVTYLRDREHNRHVIRPITAATMNILRSREVKVSIPRGIVGTTTPTADAGRIWLPVEWSGSDGDRDNLTEMLNERLKTAVSCHFDMSGKSPSVALSVPKQPPTRVTWDSALLLADPSSPYLGESAAGSVHWDLGDDSPHIAVPGGGGSGKSELVAWIVAQFLRGGGGLVVLDPKYASHRWAMNRSNVLYAADPETLHNAILWLATELARRGRESQKAEQEFPRLVVLLEERNSMQDLLRGYWRSIKQSGDPMMSPALTALDTLASQGRSLNINLVLAAQATAQVDIGKRNNYGAFAVAGRLPANAWRLAGAQKPAIAGTPGRFGYLVAGRVTVFQAAFPDVRHHPERIWEWASGGADMLDTILLYQRGTQDNGWSEPDTAADEATEEYVTLSAFAEEAALNVGTLRSRALRDSGFPEVVGTGAKNAKLYRRLDLQRWQEIHRKAS